MATKVQPADPNGFVFFDLWQKWQNIAPFSKRLECYRDNFGGESRNFEPFVKVSRLDETLLKWFWETKSHDKSFILNQNFVV